MVLVGKVVGSGNLFAKNPSTGKFGPVCDDFWTLANVSISTDFVQRFGLKINLLNTKGNLQFHLWQFKKFSLGMQFFNSR